MSYLDDNDSDDEEIIRLKDILRGDDRLWPEEVKDFVKQATLHDLIRSHYFCNAPVPWLYVMTDEGALVWSETHFESVMSFTERAMAGAVTDYTVPSSYIEEEYNHAGFWDSPCPLYHATITERTESILRDGLECRVEIRGLRNKGTGAAVFTHVDPYGYIESYGEVVLEINTRAMLRDGYTPAVSGEYPLVESEYASALVTLLRVEQEYPVDPPEDLDPGTVIVYGHIPAKYITVLETV